MEISLERLHKLHFYFKKKENTYRVIEKTSLDLYLGAALINVFDSNHSEDHPKSQPEVRKNNWKINSCYFNGVYGNW